MTMTNPYSDRLRNLIVSGESFMAPRPQTKMEYLMEWGERLGITFKPSRSKEKMMGSLVELQLKVNSVLMGN